MCDCIDILNNTLEKHNAVVDARESINMKTGVMSRVLLIPIRKINSKIRKPMPALFNIFCPICGEKRAAS